MVFANCYLIGQAIDLMDMFESCGLVEKMKNTCQFGPKKYVYPGVHYTRYEYVLTQLMLIRNIASSDKLHNVELSLKSNFSEYIKFDSDLNGSSLMQCLAILSNAGHNYDTFTASRILLSLFTESKAEKTDFYTAYKRNFPESVRKVLDEHVIKGNFYKLHLFHIIHILQGMSRPE